MPPRRTTFRVKVTGLKAAQRSSRALRDLLRSKEIQDHAGPHMVKQIRKRTYGGRGVRANGQEFTFPPLRSGRPSRLWQTGQMQRALDYSKRRTELYVKTTRRGGSSITNEDLAVRHHRGVRSWVGLSANDARVVDKVSIPWLEAQMKKAAKPGFAVRGRVFKPGGRLWSSGIAR